MYKVLKAFNFIKGFGGRHQVYADNASATMVDKVVLAEMSSVDGLFANPSSLHQLGVLARARLGEARAQVANFIGAHSDEIIFTSGGTESCNLAILGSLLAYQKKSNSLPHIITSKIEHPAVLNLIQKLESQNKITATYLNVDPDGIIDIKKLKESIVPETFLISIQLVNNEVGTIEPVNEISKIIRQYKKNNNQNIYPLLHTDCAQAMAYLPVNVLNLNIDMLSFNGQKIYGPKGSGVLYVKRKTPIDPVFIGGDQEFKIRPGTEALPQAVGLAKACQLRKRRQKSDFAKLTNLRAYFVNRLNEIEGAQVWGNAKKVSPHIVLVQFKNIFSEALILYLDARGIYVTSKSACKSFDENESYVLKALKHDIMNEQDENEGTVRFSFGRDTSFKDIDYIIKNLKEVLKLL